MNDKHTRAYKTFRVRVVFVAVLSCFPAFLSGGALWVLPSSNARPIPIAAHPVHARKRLLLIQLRDGSRSVGMLQGRDSPIFGSPPDISERMVVSTPLLKKLQPHLGVWWLAISGITSIRPVPRYFEAG